MKNKLEIEKRILKDRNLNREVPMKLAKSCMKQALMAVYVMEDVQFISAVLLSGVVASFVYLFFMASFFIPYRWILSCIAIALYVAYFLYTDKLFAFISGSKELLTYDSFIIASIVSTVLKQGESIPDSLRYASRFVRGRETKKSILRIADEVEVGISLKFVFSKAVVLPQLKGAVIGADIEKLPIELEAVADSLYAEAYHFARKCSVFPSVVLPMLLGVVIFFAILNAFV